MKTQAEKCSHKIKVLPYLAWMAWAEEQTKKGKKQVQCEKCKLWLFEEEL